VGCPEDEKWGNVYMDGPPLPGIGHMGMLRIIIDISSLVADFIEEIGFSMKLALGNQPMPNSR
jgi:hypothetical protein